MDFFFENTENPDGNFDGRKWCEMMALEVCWSRSINQCENDDLEDLKRC